MSKDVPVFYTVPNGKVRLALRRFTFSDKQKCPVRGEWGCDASVLIGTFDARYDKLCDSGRGHYLGLWRKEEFRDGPWPEKCGHCGEPFDPAKTENQVFQEAVYVRYDGGLGEFTLRDAPVGMMWDAFWMRNSYEAGEHGPGWTNVGPDGLALVIQVPRKHPFQPEQRASNCTMKDDGRHKCWVRHGDARVGLVHIDKVGHTCQAGAGSIVTPSWHGFIHHSRVTDVPDDLAGVS